MRHDNEALHNTHSEDHNVETIEKFFKGGEAAAEVTGRHTLAHGLQGIGYGLGAYHIVQEVIHSDDKVKAAEHGISMAAGAEIGAGWTFINVAPVLLRIPVYGVAATGIATAAGGVVGACAADFVWEKCQGTSLAALATMRQSQQQDQAPIHTATAQYYRSVVRNDPAEIHASKMTLSDYFLKHMQAGLESSQNMPSLLRSVNEYNVLAFTASEYGQYFSQEAWQQWHQAHHQLQHTVSRYAPQKEEQASHATLQQKTAQLKLAAKREIDLDKINPELQTILRNKKTIEELVFAVDASIVVTPEDQVVLDYIHAISDIAKKEGLSALKKQIHDAKKSGDRTSLIQGLEGASKISYELGRLSSLAGNNDLGKGLVVAGAVFQGVAAGLLIGTLQGAAVLGPVGAIIGAAVTIISTLMGGGDGSEALYELIQALREEIFELRKEMAQFKSELFTRLSIYFGEIYGVLSRLMEASHYSRSLETVHADLVQSGIEAILEQQWQDILYRALSYGDTIPANQLTETGVYELAPRIGQLLSQAEKEHYNGVALCHEQQSHGIMATRAIALSWLDHPVKQAQLFGYMACIATQDHGAALINPAVWVAAAKAYVNLLRLPASAQYDQKAMEWGRVMAQGEHFMAWMDLWKKNTPLLQQWVDEIQKAVEAYRDSLIYPDVVMRMLNKTNYSETPHATYSYDGNCDHEIVEYQRLKTPDEFAALVTIGLANYRAQHNLYQYGLREFGIHNHCFSAIKSDIHLVYPDKKAVQLQSRNNCKQRVRHVYTELDLIEARHRLMALRAPASQKIADLLAKNLSSWRNTILENSISMLVMLHTMGLPSDLLRTFPKIPDFPEELSVWVNVYRQDSDHLDPLRPLPDLNNTAIFVAYTTQLSHFLKQVTHWIAAEPQKFNSPFANQVALQLAQFHELKAARLASTFSTVAETAKVAFFEEINQLKSAIKALTNTVEAQHGELKSLAVAVQNKPASNYQFIFSGQSTWPCFFSTENNEGALVCYDRMTTPEKMRTLSKLPGVTESWQTLRTDAQYQCEPLGGVNGLHCVGVKTEYVEQFIHAAEKTLSTKLLRSAFQGAWVSVLPEAMGDALHISGLTTKARAKQIKAATSFLIMGLFFAWSEYKLLFIASIALSCVLEKIMLKMGFSEHSVSLASRAVLFSVSAGRTETDVLCAVANYTGARAGLWAEKRIVNLMASGEQADFRREH